MPNLAAVLNHEIRRLAKREVTAEIGKIRRSHARLCQEVANLRRLLDQQDWELRHLKREIYEERGSSEAPGELLEEVRYSSRSIRALRRRLGLSAADFGRLVGVSPLTVFNWEHERFRPRKKKLAALIAIRKMSKREASDMLAKLD
jgi:DNA-binding transcriptional regulator YiaG